MVSVSLWGSEWVGHESWLILVFIHWPHTWSKLAHTQPHAQVPKHVRRSHHRTPMVAGQCDWYFYHITPLFHCHCHCHLQHKVHVWTLKLSIIHSLKSGNYFCYTDALLTVILLERMSFNYGTKCKFHCIHFINLFRCTLCILKIKCFYFTLP